MKQNQRRRYKNQWIKALVLWEDKIDRPLAQLTKRKEQLKLRESQVNGEIS